MSKQLSLFATCPRYLEDLLADELRELGCDEVKSGLGGVSFQATQAGAYRVCLWSRLANRVLMELMVARVSSRDQVYAAASSVNWRSHLGENETSSVGSLTVDFTGASEGIRNTHFGSQLIKDAVVDQFSDVQRPSVDKRAPDIRINAHLAKGRLTLALDLSGDSLHRRGYRNSGGAAPLKENLAAALLFRAGWPKMLESNPQSAMLLDPMCGSGTLLVEAAMIATDRAPGLLRSNWGFSRWAQHDEQSWASILADAKLRHQKGVQRASENTMRFIGFDKDKVVLNSARKSFADLELQAFSQFECIDVKDMKAPQRDDNAPDAKQVKTPDNRMLICNPPYGERLDDTEALKPLYGLFGQQLKNQFGGWKIAVYGANQTLLEALRLRPDRKYRLRNGPLEGQLRLFSIQSELKLNDGKQQNSDGDPAAFSDQPMVEPAPALLNRLKKNRQKLQRALRSRNTNCYRLYDADIPEYASAVDIYAGSAVVTEYVAPDTIDPKKAESRLQETLASVRVALDLQQDELIYKRNQRQKGNTQYQREGVGSDYIEVHEGPVKLLVNLHDYHDTGLFLDHRPVRRLIADRVKGKRFLNLFCYTAAATAHAAVAGAETSLSVDMSAPYIRWARKNLLLNKASVYDHTLLQADCLQWLAEQAAEENSELYDLILLDPPSFSNSKRMQTVLDVQRDHADLIEQCMSLLSPEGQLIFSTNRRKFRLNADLAQRFSVEDVTKATLDPDFQRPAPAHRCWIIKGHQASVA